MSLSRAQLMDAAFRLGACAESLAHPGQKPTPEELFFPSAQIELVRRALKEVVDMLGKETK